MNEEQGTTLSPVEGEGDGNPAGGGGAADNPAATDSGDNPSPAPVTLDVAGKPWEPLFEDGQFDEKAAEKFFNKTKTEKENYEKRLLDLRRTISKGTAPAKDSEYFQDYAPDEKFLPFFEKDNEKSKLIEKLPSTLSRAYHSVGMNKEQASVVTSSILKILEGIGYLDTRTDEQRYIDAQKFIESEKRKLGNDANKIIAEARNFVDNLHILGDEDRGVLRQLMDTRGASMVNLIHKLKDMTGGSSMDIPSGDLSALGSLPSDAQLKEEYMAPGTTQARRDEIIYLRNKAGRPGRLMQA
ncbi:MAG: hypothetical protein LBQ83_01885 [Candidatus Margulisbacteria bacterium]|jgi:hypothetical protein|nr:hypothetical protein [Candidatus Margulisiibacteriota bacterium]